MEDSHIAAVNLENNVSVFGVFDGHGGNTCLNNGVSAYRIGGGAVCQRSIH